MGRAESMKTWKEKILGQAWMIGRRTENQFARVVNGNLGTDLAAPGIHSS
jgi:hypothetical protein